MSSLKSLTIINLILVLALGAYVFFPASKRRSAYILNDEVFNQFKGKQELERKLSALKKKNEATSDSLINLLSITKDMEVRNINTAIATYTVDIWKRINQYVPDYGKEHNYDFIFGASGNGGLCMREINYTFPS